MDAICVICFIILLVVGIWFYKYSCSPSSDNKRKVSIEQELLDSHQLTPTIRQFLMDSDPVTVVSVLVDKGEGIAPSLWGEIGAMLTENGREKEFVDLLQDPEPNVRAQAAEVLGYLSFPVSGLLVEALGDKNEEVRLASMAALIRRKDPSTAEPLSRALGHPGKLLPARVAQVLLALEEAAVSPLLETLKHAEPQGKPLICEVLGQLGDARAVPALTDLLNTSDLPFVRAAAAEALGNMPLDDRWIDALVTALKDESWEVRARAAKALGRAGSRKAVGAALEETAATDEDWNVRTIAKAVLGKMA